MQVTIETSGGFAPTPGLSAPVTIDTDTQPEVGAEVRDLLKSSRFFERSSVAGESAPGAADLITYTVTVKDGQNVHTARIQEPISDAELRQLVDRLLAIGRARR